MAAVDLTTLRARVREACDQTGSTFVTDAATSLDAFINVGAQELYKLLVTKFEDYFPLITQAISLVGGTSSYALGSDFFKLRGVDIQVGGNWKALRPTLFSQRNALPSTVPLDPRFLGYRLTGSSLVFTPTPSQAGSARAFYIPQFVGYVNGADAFEWWGWEEYIVQIAAARVAVKEETDPSPYMAEAARIRGLIDAEAANRDASEPGSVGDADISSDLEEYWA